MSLPKEENFFKEIADIFFSEKDQEIFKEIINTSDPIEQIKKVRDYQKEHPEIFRKPSLVERYRRNEKEKKELEETISKMDEGEKEQFWKEYHGQDNNLLSKINDTVEEILMEIQILRKEMKNC